MIMYLVTVLVFVLIFLNYFLGFKLYKEPQNEGYFKNVKNYNVIHQRDIMASPRYVFLLSVGLGIFAGMYVLLGRYLLINSFVIFITVFILFILYLIEITREIRLTEDTIEFGRLFFRTKRIPLTEIDGMYIYSYNKRFLNKHAFTTKLITVTGNKKYKFTLSGINIRAVLNMMKENFGINEYKMFIPQK